MSPLEAPPTLYEAKRDGWIVGVMWAANLLLLAAAALLWRSDQLLVWRALYAAVIVATTFFLLWILYGTRYVLTDDRLLAVCGPFKFVVPLAAIEEVRPSRSPLSGPAPSLDRLEILHSGKTIGLLVSPLDKEGFLADLKLRCPQLVGRFDRLVTKER